VATAALPLPAASESADRYKYRYIIAVTVSLASVLELLDTSIVNVAIPHMMGNLGATLDEIAWVSTGYIVANVIILPITGWLSAYFGRRRYFAGSIAIFIISSFFCGNAHSLVALVFWRIIQGLGGGALLSTSQAILYEEFPREEYGTAMAIFGVGVMVHRRSGRRWAGTSPMPSGGPGSSTSTSRSACWRWPCPSRSSRTRASSRRPSGWTTSGWCCSPRGSARCRRCSSGASGSTGSSPAKW